MDCNRIGENSGGLCSQDQENSDSDADGDACDACLGTGLGDPIDGRGCSCHQYDLDGDGDTDVLSASYNGDKVAWYENDGSSSAVFTEHIISTTANGAQSVFAADVDGDGDIDALSALTLASKIIWYENDGGSPPSWRELEVRP